MEESYYYGFDEGFGVDGANGRNGRCRCGFFGGTGGFGLGEVVGVVGGAVARCYLLAVAGGGESCGVAGLVGLDGDSGGFTNGVVDGFIVGLLRHGLAASATHCKQGKRRYEGSR